MTAIARGTALFTTKPINSLHLIFDRVTSRMASFHPDRLFCWMAHARASWSKQHIL